jgi:hypothetical protein
LTIDFTYALDTLVAEASVTDLDISLSSIKNRIGEL